MRQWKEGTWKWEAKEGEKWEKEGAFQQTLEGPR